MKPILVLGLTAALSAHAQQVQIAYTGAVTSLTYADCTAFANGNCSAWNFTSIASTDFLNGQTIAVGNAYSGGFVYDATAPLTAISSDGHQAIHLSSVSYAEFQGGGVALPSLSLPAAGFGSFSVVNDRNGFDSFYVTRSFSQGEWFAQVNFHLQDSTGTVFNSFAVPTNLDFTLFNANVFNVGMLRRTDGDQVQLNGTITSAIFTSAVPEPTTAGLLLVGLLAVLGLQVAGPRRSRTS